MSVVNENRVGTWTAADLFERFGPIRLDRIRTNPVPGTATEEDAIAIHDHEDRLCELVDGLLIEKPTGIYDDDTRIWTAADLFERFGPIPLERVRTNPVPGTATEEDAIAIHDHENRLCELVDGLLLEKTVGSYESLLGGVVFRLIANYVAEKDLGIVLPADGMMRLAPGRMRIPDVSFISWQRLPGRRFPRSVVWDLVPDLAIEVISKNNTREEMDRKRAEYFGVGVRVVWYVYPDLREVRVYSSPSQVIVLSEHQTLDGGDILPGLRVPLGLIFAEPAE